VIIYILHTSMSNNKSEAYLFKVVHRSCY